MFRVRTNSRESMDFVMLSSGTDKHDWSAPPAAPAIKDGDNANDSGVSSLDNTSPYVVKSETPTVAFAIMNGK
jgi:hypothetical protein